MDDRDKAQCAKSVEAKILVEEQKIMLQVLHTVIVEYHINLTKYHLHMYKMHLSSYILIYEMILDKQCQPHCQKLKIIA